jgi:hypothetical protein
MFCMYAVVHKRQEAPSNQEQCLFADAMLSSETAE